MSFLPHPHPNIVQMYKAFTDCIPALEDARNLYPEALPTADFYELIIDEPKTLFIVMRRQITYGALVGCNIQSSEPDFYVVFLPLFSLTLTFYLL